ncbi:regulator of sigma E protease, partial [Trypanosoma cruzi]
MLPVCVAGRCWWWCTRRLPRWQRGSTTTATTLMAWSSRMAMGTGGRWSRTGRGATRGVSGWQRLGCRRLHGADAGCIGCPGLHEGEQGDGGADALVREFVLCA